MYNNVIINLLQTSKTAELRLKTSLMNAFQFINDVEYLQTCAHGRNTRLKLALSRLVKGRSVLIKLECEPCMIVQHMET